jgi:SAM domain (Sterile alpha motif)
MDIGGWLRGLGLEGYARVFRENEIDERVLPKLTADDLKELGIAALGHRRLLLEAIAALRADATSAEATPPPAASGITPPRPAWRCPFLEISEELFELAERFDRMAAAAEKRQRIRNLIRPLSRYHERAP